MISLPFNNVGGFIRHFRQSQHFSQEMLAAYFAWAGDEYKTTQSQISRWETGKEQPKAECVYLLMFNVWGENTPPKRMFEILNN